MCDEKRPCYHTRDNRYCSGLSVGLLRVKPVLRCYHTGTITTVKDWSIPYSFIDNGLTRLADFKMLLNVRSDAIVYKSIYYLGIKQLPNLKSAYEAVPHTNVMQCLFQPGRLKQK